MTRLILQVNVKLEQPIDNMKRFRHYDDMYDISMHQARKFASKWGADYQVITDCNFLPGKHPTYQRLKMFELDYDQILYLDCDAIIMDNCPSIFDLYGHHDFSAVRDFEWDNPKYDKQRQDINKVHGASNKYRPFCAGVILANRSFLAKNRDKWRQYIDKFDKKAHDQSILNQLIVDSGEQYNELDGDWGTWSRKGKFIDHLGGRLRKINFDAKKYVVSRKLEDWNTNSESESLFIWQTNSN